MKFVLALLVAFAVGLEVSVGDLIKVYELGAASHEKSVGTRTWLSDDYPLDDCMHKLCDNCKIKGKETRKSSFETDEVCKVGCINDEFCFGISWRGGWCYHANEQREDTENSSGSTAYVNKCPRRRWCCDYVERNYKHPNAWSGAEMGCGMELWEQRLWTDYNCDSVVGGRDIPHCDRDYGWSNCDESPLKEKTYDQFGTGSDEYVLQNTRRVDCGIMPDGEPHQAKQCESCSYKFHADGSKTQRGSAYCQDSKDCYWNVYHCMPNKPDSWVG